MLAGNDHGLLPWRTSNIMNVRRPEQRNFFIGRCEGRAEPWQQTDVIGRSRRANLCRLKFVFLHCNNDCSIDRLWSTSVIESNRHPTRSRRFNQRVIQTHFSKGQIIAVIF